MILVEVIGEVGPLKGAVTAGRLVEDWDVRVDVAFVDQPRKHLR
jgi:hypothetical protein